MSEHNSSAHRELRELLGAYALGALPDEARAQLRAHLDGCAACRDELGEIAPLADALRLVKPDALSTVPVPPADLGDRIVGRIAEERALVSPASPPPPVDGTDAVDDVPAAMSPPPPAPEVGHRT